MVKNKSTKKNTEIVIFKNSKGHIDFNIDIEKETLWGNLNQIAEVFGRDKSVISRHIKDILASGELTSKATVAKNATVQTEGIRVVEREIDYYNLDMIISIGYRVNSLQATRFRQYRRYSCSSASATIFRISGQAVSKRDTWI